MKITEQKKPVIIDTEKIEQKKSFLDVVLNNKALFILILLGILATILNPVFLKITNLVNVVRQVSTYCILCTGFTFIMSSGNLDLSVGHMMGFMGVIMALMSKAGIPFVFVVLGGLVLGAFCGFLNGFIGMKTGIPLFIVTLATGLAFRGLSMICSHNTPVTGLQEAFRFIGQGYIGPVPFPIVLTVVFALIMWILLNKTKFGRQAVATGGNKEAARTSGINTSARIIQIYTIMGCCVALAAMVMTGRAFSAQPAAGQDMGMDCIAAVVIGGTSMSGGHGKLVGSMFGCLIIGVINNMLNLAGIDSNWQLVTKGLIILVAVFLDILTTKYFSAQLKKK